MEKEEGDKFQSGDVVFIPVKFTDSIVCGEVVEYVQGKGVPDRNIKVHVDDRLYGDVIKPEHSLLTLDDLKNMYNEYR